VIELFLDTETFSTTPIKHGTYKYAENAEVMIVTYAIGDGPVHDMDMTREDPADVLRLRNLVSNADVIICHNTMFDRNVLRLGNLKIEVPPEKFRCSMVKALLHGLPGGLDKLCDILGVPTDLAKHKTGRALIHLFCKPIAFAHAIPRADYPTIKAWKEAIEEAKKHWQGRATRETHPVQWAQFIEYARADIPAMREVWRRLPSWNYGETGAGALERDLWHLDQKINDRGVCIDLPLVHAAIRATNDEQTRLKSRVVAHTDGYVEAATQRDRMLEFIFTEYGVGLADLTKSTVAKLLEKEGTPPELVELLQLRAQASQTSTAKYNAFARGTSADGRLRGMLQFSGAARTRRDAGRTVQLQNLPSRGLLAQYLIDLGILALLAECEDITFDNIMLLVSSVIRSVIVAPKGKKLVVSDLANIEGRGLAWLAGEEWKLQAFRDFDTILGYDDLTGEALRAGPDLYKLAYAKAFRIQTEAVTKFGRSIGKVMELGLGYAGGINAFVTFALVYGIDLEEMADTAWATLPPEMVAEAESFIDWLEDKGHRWPMSRRAVIVCEVFKRLWREAHPMTVQLWAEMELGFKRATNNPGQTYRYRGFAFRRDGMWLRIRLPSGRYLCYPSPQVDADGQCSFMGVDQFTRKWTRVKTYGGKIVENATQSVARDFMFDAMPGIEAAGYEIVLRVHDEVPCYAPDTPEFNAEHLSGLLATNPPWAPDMPLAAAGFEGYRYKKD
jgi:DNA polymerase